MRVDSLTQDNAIVFLRHLDNVHVPSRAERVSRIREASPSYPTSSPSVGPKTTAHYLSEEVGFGVASTWTDCALSRPRGLLNNRQARTAISMMTLPAYSSMCWREPAKSSHFQVNRPYLATVPFEENVSSSASGNCDGANIKGLYPADIYMNQYSMTRETLTTAWMASCRFLSKKMSTASDRQYHSPASSKTKLNRLLYPTRTDRWPLSTAYESSMDSSTNHVQVNLSSTRFDYRLGTIGRLGHQDRLSPVCDIEPSVSPTMPSSALDDIDTTVFVDS